MEKERLARIEEKQDNLRDLIERHLKSQEKSNDFFYEVARRVTVIETTNKTGWKLIGAFGAITVAVASAAAWIVTHIKLRLMGM